MFVLKVIAVALLGAAITMIWGHFRGSFDDSRFSNSRFFSFNFRQRTEEENKRFFYLFFISIYLILTIFAFKSDSSVFKWYSMAFCSGSSVFLAKYLIEDYKK